MTTNRKPGLFVRTMDVLVTFLSASAVTSALKLGREPEPRHLRALGIDPAGFRAIARS